MFAWLKDRKNRRNVTDRLYDAAVTQSRSPVFYRDLGVPDSLEGRYELLVAHLFLAIERLRAAGQTQQELSRTLVERFVTDMDDTMRELGVGDTSVPKNVKTAAAGLLERTNAYRASLAEGPEELARELRKNLNDGVMPNGDTPPDVVPTAGDLIIARYLIQSANALAAQPLEDMLTAGPQFAALEETP